MIKLPNFLRSRRSLGAGVLKNAIYGHSIGQRLLILSALLCAPNLLGQTSTHSVQFTDITQQAGIKFVHYPGNNGIATMGAESSPATHSTTTTAMVLSRTSLIQPVFPALAMAWGASGETTIMTASPIYMSPSWGATSSITITATARSPMSLIRQE